MTMTLVDLQVGPYDPPEKIKEEIERVKVLGDDPGIEAAVQLLEDWLLIAEEAPKN